MLLNFSVKRFTNYTLKIVFQLILQCFWNYLDCQSTTNSSEPALIDEQITPPNSSSLVCIDRTLFRWNLESHYSGFNKDGQFCVQSNVKTETKPPFKDTTNLLNLPPLEFGNDMVNIHHRSLGLVRDNHIYVTPSTGSQNCTAERLDLMTSDTKGSCSNRHLATFPANLVSQCPVKSAFCQGSNVNLTELWPVLASARKVWRTGGVPLEGACSNDQWSPVSFETSKLAPSRSNVVVRLDVAFHRVGLKDNSLRYVSQMRVTVGSEEEPDQLVDSSDPSCTLVSVLKWWDVSSK